MSLPQGSTLNATILATLSKGELRVSTQFGELVLKTPLNLPQGGDLSLTLLGQVRGQALLKMAALNGRPLTSSGLQGAGQGAGQGGGVGIGAGGAGTGAVGQASGLPGAGAGQGTAGGGGAQAVTVSLGSSANSGIAATVVRAATGPLSFGAKEGAFAGVIGGARQTVPAPPLGAQLVVRVAQVTPSSVSGMGGGTTGVPGGAIPPAGPGSSEGIPPRAMAANTEGGDGSKAAPLGRVSAAAEGSSSGGAARVVANDTLQVLTGRSVPGRVLSAGTGAQPVIDTDIGQLALRARLDVRPGDLVQLQIIGRPAIGAATTTAATATATGAPLPAPPSASAVAATQAGQGVPPLTSGTGWPTLSESLRIMASSEGGGANNPLLAAMPKAGPSLAAAVTSFVGAIRNGGDTEKWPGGPAMRALERTGGKKGTALAGRLGSEMRDMASRASEGSGEWRTFNVPFLAGADIDPIRVILRRLDSEGEDDSEAGKGRKEQGQRFLVELDLSRLGPLQFDGLYKKKGRALDLVVRARDALPSGVRYDIQVLYNTALVTMGLTGRVHFDFTGGFVRPPVAPPGGSERGLGLGAGPGGVLV